MRDVRDDRLPDARDYFAAHAPEVPYWFWHRRPAAGEPKRPSPAEFFPESPDDQRAVRDWFMEPTYDLHLSDGRQEGFVKAAKKYWEDKRRWEADDEMARMVQWRFHFADAMLDGRHGPDIHPEGH